jgi:hypothetical protein
MVLDRKSLPANPVGEQNLWAGSPSSRVTVVEMVRPALLTISLVLIALSVINIFFEPGPGEPDPSSTKLAIVALALVASGLFIVKALWEARAYRLERYIVSNQRIHKPGRPRQWEVDIQSVDAVRMQATRLEQMLGIGDVEIFFSGGKIPHRLRSVEDPIALQERIRTAVYQATGKRPALRD